MGRWVDWGGLPGWDRVVNRSGQQEKRAEGGGGGSLESLVCHFARAEGGQWGNRARRTGTGRGGLEIIPTKSTEWRGAEFGGAGSIPGQSPGDGDSLIDFGVNFSVEESKVSAVGQGVDDESGVRTVKFGEEFGEGLWRGWGCGLDGRLEARRGSTGGSMTGVGFGEWGRCKFGR